MDMDEVNDTNDLEDTVSDEENDPSINGVKNDNIDDSTISNQNDVLDKNGSADVMNNNINASNEHLISNNNDDPDNLLTANKLVSKNADNLREAEARTDEVPLRTHNTDRVEESEEEQ